MAIPLNKSTSGKWKSLSKSRSKRELDSDEEPEESESLRRVRAWQMTDQSDNPTRRGAWSLFQDSVKECYAKPLRRIDLDHDLNEVMNTQMSRARSRNAAYYGQFSMLERDAGVTPRYRRDREPLEEYRPSSGVRHNRFYRRKYETTGPGSDLDSDVEEDPTWAAPGRANPRVKSTYSSRPVRLERSASAIRAKTSTYSYEPDELDPDPDYDSSSVQELMPRRARPHYSRRTNFDDPDYFDYDLMASVEKFKDVFKTARSQTTPTMGVMGMPVQRVAWVAGFTLLSQTDLSVHLGSSVQMHLSAHNSPPKFPPIFSSPTAFEKKVVGGLGDSPDKMLSPYLFRSENPAASSVPQNAGGSHSGYLGAALRTPGYWTKRFEDVSDLCKYDFTKPIPPPTERAADVDYDSDTST